MASSLKGGKVKPPGSVCFKDDYTSLPPDYNRPGKNKIDKLLEGENLHNPKDSPASGRGFWEQGGRGVKAYLHTPSFLGGYTSIPPGKGGFPPKGGEKLVDIYQWGSGKCKKYLTSGKGDDRIEM